MMKALPPCLLLMIISIASGRCEGNLQQEMDQMMNAMTNTSRPEVVMSQRRGVFSGGSLTIRNRIMQAQPISIVPPSFGGGCGGIDLYGGSFSFINSDQFVTMMRSIAGNAGGYAFQLAINAMCPDCGSVMTDLQRKVQQFNQLFSNSCQLAQGLVNDGMSAIDTQNKSRMSNLSLSQGMSDVFGSMAGNTSAGDPLEQAQHADPGRFAHDIQGNLIWRALHQGNVKAWFKTGSDGLLEEILSITGTLILEPPVQSPDGKGSNLPVTVLPPLMGLKDLLVGSERASSGIRCYRCDTLEVDGCLHPVTEYHSLAGLHGRVKNILLGDDGMGGLVGKFSSNQGTLSKDEEAFMAAAPTAIGAMLRNLAREDKGLAHLFAEEAAPLIAIEMAKTLIQDLLDAARISAINLDHAYAGRLNDYLDQVVQDSHEVSSDLGGRFGDPQSLLRFYQDLERTLKPKNYGGLQHALGSITTRSP